MGPGHFDRGARRCAGLFVGLVMAMCVTSCATAPQRPAPEGATKTECGEAPPRSPPPSPARPPKVIRDGVPWPAVVLFRRDSTELHPEAQTELDIPVRWLTEHPHDTVTIAGHTCDLGDETHNYQLGLRRAEAAKRYLVERGIDPSRITVESKGETAPAVENIHDANRKLNRRAVFHYQPVDVPNPGPSPNRPAAQDS